MITLKATPEFTAWMDALPDVAVRGVVVARLARLARLAHGLTGDVAPVGGGISELRIHLGAGWRVYYVQRGEALIVLLAGGAKNSQARGIRRAKALAERLI